MRWQRDRDVIVPSPEGIVELTIDGERECFVYMVEAKGYQPAVTRLLYPGETNVALVLELEKSAPRRGTVIRPNGEFVPNIKVFQCLEELDFPVVNGIPVHKTFRITDKKVQFVMNTEILTKYLVACNDEGFGQIEYEDFCKQGMIVLEPWATVRGILERDSKPVSAYELEARTHDEHDGWGGCYCYSKATTDQLGRFELNRIPPGYMVLYGRQYRVEAGETYELLLGHTTLTVAGQVPIPAQVYRGSYRFGHLLSLDSPTHSTVFNQIRCDETGWFEAELLEPGPYVLVGTGWKYRFWHEFRVTLSTIESGRLDLGEIPMLNLDLAIGDLAAPFRYSDLEGNTLSSDGLTGTLTLLSFYRARDLKHPDAEILALQEIYQRFGKTASFTMLGMLSSLNTVSKDRDLVENAGFAWPHLRIGRNKWNRAHVEYRVPQHQWPWNILISPEGKVLGVGLKGDVLIETITAHLP